MQKENKKIAKNTSVEMLYCNISIKSKGFTLVELIIVITILAILGTIAYISFQGYTKDARDGIRMSDIKQIYNGLSIYKAQTEKTLLPDNYINIQSGTTTISYQGYAGAGVLRSLKISGGKDPGTKDYYIYTTDVNTKKAQLMTYMETSDKDAQLLGKLKNLNVINQAEAVTNTGYYQDKKIYVYGDKIGILTNSNKVPLQETTTSTGIDITSLTGNITTYFGGTIYSSGLTTSTGITLVNQINGVLNGTIPCNQTTYSGYTIISLQDKQIGIFIKTGTILNGTQTGTILATCNNGILSYGIESFQNGCNSGYLWDGSSCIFTSGVCGSASSSIVSFIPPTTNLCSNGVPTVSGTITSLSSSVGYTYVGSILNWTWTCNSTNGGTNASCSVPSLSATQWQDYYSGSINSIISQNNWTSGSDSFTSVLGGTVPTGGSSILAQNGNIYIIPGYSRSSGKIMKFNPNTNTLTVIASGVGLYGNGVLHPNGKIYAPPYAGGNGNILVIDTNNDTWSTIGSSISNSYRGSILAPNGKIYSSSCGVTCGASAYNVLVFNPSDDSYTVIANGQSNHHGKLSLGPNGNIYSSYSVSAGNGAIINPFTNGFSTYSAGCNTYGIQMAGNGKLYAFGLNSCSISLDTNTNTYTNIGGGIWSHGPTLSPNGKLYGSPYASQITFYDPYGVTSPSNISGSPSGGYYRPFALASNGKMYAFPTYTYTDIIVLTPGGVTKNFDMNTLLSPYVNNN